PTQCFSRFRITQRSPYQHSPLERHAKVGRFFRRDPLLQPKLLWYVAGKPHAHESVGRVHPKLARPHLVEEELSIRTGRHRIETLYDLHPRKRRPALVHDHAPDVRLSSQNKRRTIHLLEVLVVVKILLPVLLPHHRIRVRQTRTRRP